MDTTFNPDHYINTDELAAYLGCANALALSYERQAGAVSAPDTVFDGRAYWSCETAKRLFADRLSAIHQAFGHPSTEAFDAPDPLSHPGVTHLRLIEGRWSPRPTVDGNNWGWA